MTAAIIVIALVGLALTGGALQRRLPRLRRFSANFLISYFILVVFTGAAELYFRYVYDASETSLTLTGKNWVDRYWHTNALGFRDREWTAADWQGKQTILVVGDSFAAGWGIANPEDRFSNVLAQQLGDEYAVINLGVYGTSTPEQLEVLRNYPLQNPDVIILQYLLNDINYAALSIGLLPESKPSPKLVQESDLANFLYHRLQAWIAPSGYEQWTYAAYDNPAIWAIHRQELELFIDYVELTGADLIVVIFPHLDDPFGSIAYVDRVAQVFQARGHDKILKLFDAAAAWDPKDLFVSALDAHPSPAFHHYVGETLYQLFFAELGT